MTCLLRDDSLLKKITEATTIDKFATEVKASIINPSHEPERHDLGWFTIQDNLLYVPKGPCRMRVLHECHNDPLVGHFGIDPIDISRVLVVTTMEIGKRVG